MKTAAALAYFGSLRAAARNAGVTRQYVQQWPAIVPWRAAVALWKASDGKLDIALDDYLTKHGLVRQAGLAPQVSLAVMKGDEKA